MPLLDLSAELLRPVGELERGTKASGGPLCQGAVPQDEALAIFVASRGGIGLQLLKGRVCPPDFTRQQQPTSQDIPGAVEVPEAGLQSPLDLGPALDQLSRSWWRSASGRRSAPLPPAPRARPRHLGGCPARAANRKTGRRESV